MTMVYTAQGPEASLAGNVLTIHKLTFAHIEMLVDGRRIDQFSVRKIGGTDEHPLYDLSYAMREMEHKTYAGLIHRYNTENKLKKKVDNKGGKPDNTPPKGTPPRGGGGKVVEYQKVRAIAA